MEEGSQGSDEERSQCSNRETSSVHQDDDDDVEIEVEVEVEVDDDDDGVDVEYESHNSREDGSNDYVDYGSHDSIEDRSYGYDSDERCPKQRRTEETVKQDQICTMPDAVLLHILSFLPTKDAVKTGTLAQRWLYLWTSLPSLDFNYTVWQFRTLHKFVTFVDQTLIFHKCCDIEKFRIRFDYDHSYASCIDKWVRFATRANVKELCLDLDGRTDMDEDVVDQYVLPQHVYKNSSITKLSLTMCDVAPNGLISWKSLKNLSIGFTKLSEAVIQKILLGSPILEILELYRFYGFNHLDIGPVRLRKLVLRDFWNSLGARDETTLKISAPNLQSLAILGSMYWKELRLMDVQSLVDCNLNFDQSTLFLQGCNGDERPQNMLRELLNSLRRVKKLTMGHWCIQVLSMLEMKGVLSPLSVRNCLILDTQIGNCDIPGIAGLLRSSPNLETLVINMTSFYRFENQFFHKNFPKNYWTSQKWSFKCSLLHLKTVKIVGFRASYLEFELGIRFIQFLLESARFLKNMVINVGKTDYMECSPKELLQVAQKLLSLPRSSPHAVVIFSE